MNYKRCFAKVSLNNVRENLIRIRKAAGESASLLTVVKANAYGHGSIRLSQAVEDITDLFGVACTTEALELRDAGIVKPILVLGYTSPSQYEEMIRGGISAAIYSYDDAKKLSETAVSLHEKASVHIAVDSGMTRIGFRFNQTSADLVTCISRMQNLSVDGIFTHLSCADMFDPGSEDYTKMQLAEFKGFIQLLEEKGVSIPLKHAYNSAGLIRFDIDVFNCVRSGLITYGMYPSPELKSLCPDLKPALSWYAHVIHVAEVESGRGVSYGATYHTNKPMTKIATVSAGYADGYPRSLSNKGSVIIRGKPAPIIGRVCMDQFMVDATDIPDVQTEDLATLIGQDGDHQISADDISREDHTINYEVTCRISPRVERIYDID